MKKTLRKFSLFFPFFQQFNTTHYPVFFLCLFFPSDLAASACCCKRSGECPVCGLLLTPPLNPLFLPSKLATYGALKKHSSNSHHTFF